MPVVPFQHDGAPQMLVGRHNLAQGVGKNLGVGILLLHPLDHALKAVNLGEQIFAAGLGTLNAQAKLEVLFVALQNVGKRGNLAKAAVQLLFPPSRRWRGG